MFARLVEPKKEMFNPEKEAICFIIGIIPIDVP